MSNNQITMDIQKIIQLLTELGVPQQEMAKFSGITQGRISQILKDGGNCSWSAGKRLEELLDKKSAKDIT
jgi:predicted transcriptional regulator